MASRMRMTLLVAVAALHVFSFDLFEQPVVTETSAYIHVAGRIADGAVLYVDVFEIKTPLTYFVGAALVHLGRVTGIDELVVIRAGFLLFAALTAVVIALAHAQLAGRRTVAAWVALLVFCGFGLLGFMPSVGNVAKQLTMLCAGLALLMVHMRRWTGAGTFVVLAGMDWQPGGLLVGLAVLAALLCTRRRLRAGLLTAAGMVVTSAPFLLYFAYHDALRAAWEQTVLVPSGKASHGVPLDAHLRRIWRTIEADCSGEMGLVALGLAGLLLFPVLVSRSTTRSPLAVGLGVFHYGVVAWSLYDFQLHGDLFLLLGSLAFFAAVPVILAWRTLDTLSAARARRSPPGSARATRRRRRRVALGATAILALVVTLRPSFLDGGWRPTGSAIGPLPYGLAEQREVADQLARLADGRRVVWLDRLQAHLLFLAGIEEALGLVYWHPVWHEYFKRGDESSAQTLRRLLDEAQPDVVLVPNPDADDRHIGALRWCRTHCERQRLASRNGQYALDVWVRP